MNGGRKDGREGGREEGRRACMDGWVGGVTELMYAINNEWLHEEVSGWSNEWT